MERVRTLAAISSWGFPVMQQCNAVPEPLARAGAGGLKAMCSGCHVNEICHEHCTSPHRLTQEVLAVMRGRCDDRDKLHCRCTGGLRSHDPPTEAQKCRAGTSLDQVALLQCMRRRGGSDGHILKLLSGGGRNERLTIWA